jgi:uncharacterized membrane protein HdeD (DUF308 family)
MASNHRKKFITNLIIGFVLITGGLFVIAYTASLKKQAEEWYLVAFGIIILINGGLLFLGSALVHKVKADLIRRQRQKDQSKKYEFE